MRFKELAMIQVSKIPLPLGIKIYPKDGAKNLTINVIVAINNPLTTLIKIPLFVNSRLSNLLLKPS